MYHFPITVSLFIPQEVHLSFIVAASNLKADVYGLKQVRDHAAIKKMVDKVKVPEFKPKSGVKISVTDADLEASNAGNGGFGEYCSFSYCSL